MRRKQRLVLVGLAVVLLLAVVSTSMGTTADRITPSELHRGDYQGQRVTLEGRATDVQIGGDVEFTLVGNDTTARVRVVAERTPPVTLEDGRIVIVEGVVEGDRVRATTIKVRAHEGTSEPAS
jgi:cytochrome c-type biogenesis protein CcmE